MNSISFPIIIIAIMNLYNVQIGDIGNVYRIVSLLGKSRGRKVGEFTLSRL